MLVVDDDRAVRDSLRRSLEFNGYEVVLAADGAEALVTLGVQHPDVVVIDVMMPRPAQPTPGSGPPDSTQTVAP